MILPGELAKHAVSEGMKAVTKYNMCCNSFTNGRDADDIPEEEYDDESDDESSVDLEDDSDDDNNQLQQ